MPAGYRPKARYVVEALLDGLGLAPQWVGREGLAGGGLYYGEAPEDAPASALRLRLAPETVAFFVARRPYDGVPGTLDGAPSLPVLFGGEAEGGIHGADVLASAFFWLSGWDETTTPARDVHGRFGVGHALLARLDPSLPPLVDGYRAWLGARLAERAVAVPGRTWGGKRWAVALTVDVDVVRTRRIGQLARALRAGRVGEGLRALASGDARWEALPAFQALAEAHGARATWFFKAGASTPHDVPYRLEAPRLRRFLETLRGSGHEVGLHPSYAAFDHPCRLAAERDRLARVTGEAPGSVRTHFLRWAEPTTPRLLAAAGFDLDSTLGFSRREGFRRAVATPFRLYDAQADRPLGLRELPLAVMDTTLFEHAALGPETAEARAWAVCDAARRANGCAVLLWHNGPTDPREAATRFAVLARLLDRARADGALVAGLREAVSAWKPGAV